MRDQRLQRVKGLVRGPKLVHGGPGATAWDSPHSCAPFVLSSLPTGGHNFEESSGGSGSPSPGGNPCDSGPCSCGRQTWGDDLHSHCSCPAVTLTVAMTGGLLHVLSDTVSAPRQLCSLTPPRSIPSWCPRPLHTALSSPLSTQGRRAHHAPSERELPVWVGVCCSWPCPCFHRKSR